MVKWLMETAAPLLRQLLLPKQGPYLQLSPWKVHIFFPTFMMFVHSSRLLSIIVSYSFCFLIPLRKGWTMPLSSHKVFKCSVWTTQPIFPMIYHFMIQWVETKKLKRMRWRETVQIKQVYTMISLYCKHLSIALKTTRHRP